MGNGFVEKINTVANSVNTAAGDVVEDTKDARDQAVLAAETSSINATNVEQNTLLAEAWATKGHNNPVEPGKFSAYHWATEAMVQIGDPVVNNTTISQNYTWSSSKINDELSTKSDVGHTHTGIYEPVILKKTGFNRDISDAVGDNGSSVKLAREDHTHSALYEPKLAFHGTAFNKDFGTTSGTVMEGNRNFDDKYMPKVSTGTAYNKNFVSDTNNPLPTEVPRGNHIHKASGVTFNNTGTSISSGTVQGAITEVSALADNITVAEKTKLTAGMSNPNQIVTINTAGVGEKLTTAMTVGPLAKNAFYSNGGIVIAYNTPPEKLIEGDLIALITMEVLPNKAYKLALAKNGVSLGTAFTTEIGDATKTLNGSFSVTLGGFISGLGDRDELSVLIYNMTDNTDVLVYNHTISFSGQPEGALVASGITVTHDDILARDALNQHPTTSIYDAGSATSLDVILNSKAGLIATPTADNLVSVDALGQPQDSGLSIAAFNAKMEKVTTPVLDNLVSMTTAGDSKNSGVKVSDLAKVAGDTLQVFNAANATLATHVVNKGQMDALAATYTLDATFTTHTSNTANPHGVTHTQVGAAAAEHTHAMTDITSLSDTFNTKYTKIAGAITNNIPKFGATGELVDSGYPALNPSTFAPLASPALTGTPTAPTAIVGTNTTQLATTAHVFNTIAEHAEDASYGLVWNETADTYSRVGDSDYTRIQAKLRRCVLDENAQVKYYLHPNNSNLKMDGTPAVLDGSDGDVMVEVPLTYMKYTYGTAGSVTHSWEISDVPETGFAPHPCFVRAGEVVNFRYYPAYEGTVIDGRLRSVSGQYPTTNITRAAFRNAAKANGTNYHQLDWLLYEFITTLAIIEYGTMNIQAALGQGRTALTGGSWVGGSLIGITGLSNQYGNSSANYTFAGDANATDADSSFMSYRGCENFFGNVWKFVDGLNIQNHVPFVNDNYRTFDDDVFAGDYKSTGVTLSAADGYTRTLHNSDKGFFPKSVSGGSASVGTTAYFSQASGNRIVLVGGRATGGLSAGPLCLSASNVASTVSVHIGGALSA